MFSHNFISLCPPFHRFGSLGRSWGRIRTGFIWEENQRIDLLSRLACSLLQYYLCPGCLRLHLWQHVDLSSPKFQVRKCVDFIPSDRLDHILLRPVSMRQCAEYSCHRLDFVQCPPCDEEILLRSIVWCSCILATVYRGTCYASYDNANGFVHRSGMSDIR